MQYDTIMICTECKKEQKHFGMYGTNYPYIKSDIIHYLENKDCDNCDGALTVKEIKFKPNHMKLFD